MGGSKMKRFYFISVAFVITVFFAFTAFSGNQIMLEKLSTDGRVETMCSTISVFLMVFVIFYMTYSNRFFLRRRTKELGIYALLGFRISGSLFLLTGVQILILCSAFVCGILAGALAHKGIVFTIGKLLRLGIDNSKIPLFDGSAIVKTAVFVSVVILVLAASNGFFLYQTSLMDLIRFEKNAEKKLNTHRLPALLGFLLILGGYLLALDILRRKKSFWITAGFYQTGLLTLFLVVSGTVLFIAAFLPYIIEKSKQCKSRFYTALNIIAAPNFIYRIRSNARTLIILTLLSAAALTVSGVMSLTLYYPIAAMSRIAPSEIEFRLEDETQLEDVAKLTAQYTSGSTDVKILRTDLYQAVSGFECISLSQYRALLEAQNRTDVSENLPCLSENECILLKYMPDEKTDQKYVLRYPGSEQSVTVKQVSLDNTISFANSPSTLVVNDLLYQKISTGQPPYASIISLNGPSLKNNEALYQALSDYLGGSPYLQGNSHRIHELLYLNSSTFLLIGFLVVLFFIAAGCILYFNNLSMAADSRADYEILAKIGYPERLIRQIIRRQVLSFFIIPFLLGLLDCLFASMVYKAGLMQNLLGNAPSQYLPVLAAVLLSALIYGIYYILTVHSCWRAALK